MELVPKPQADVSPTASHKARFELSVANASMVSVAGTFNDWNPDATPLLFMGGTKWVRRLALPPGRYEYRYVVDGRWVEPANAKAYVANEHGGRNAVVEI